QLLSLPTRRSYDLIGSERHLHRCFTDGNSHFFSKTFRVDDRDTVTCDVGNIKLLPIRTDRKSTRLNSSHVSISYAVFCLKKKKKHKTTHDRGTTIHC